MQSILCYAMLCCFCAPKSLDCLLLAASSGCTVLSAVMLPLCAAVFACFLFMTWVLIYEQ